MQVELQSTFRLMLWQATVGMMARLSCQYTAGRRGRQPSAWASIMQAAQRMTLTVRQVMGRTRQGLAQMRIPSSRWRRTPSQTPSSK